MTPATLPFRTGPTLDEVQSSWIEALCAERAAGVRSTVLECATGTGKTIAAAKFIRRGIDSWKGRFLFICDEINLIDQTEDKFARWGLKVAVEQANRKFRDLGLFGEWDAVVATRQTLTDARLRRTFGPDQFTDVIVDEAHIGVKGKQLKNILAYLTGVRFTVGLSATPWFANGERIVPKYFDTTAATYPLETAIGDGNLVPVRLIERESPVDLRKVDIVMTANGRDFHAGQLEDRINAGVGAIANIARSEIERYDLRRCLHFTPSVKSAINLASAYTQLGIISRAIYGDCPDRDAIMRDYHEGRIRVMTGCSMFTKGFDDPPTDGLVMGRPTMSLALAYQMLGRGTRLSPDTGKHCCRAIGFNWQAKGKGPVSTLDLFMQDLDEATRKIAAKLVRMGRDVDVMKARDKAKEIRDKELDAERKKAARTAARIAAQRRDIGGRRREFARFGGNETTLQRLAALPERPGMATREQVERLCALDMDFEQASRMTLPAAAAACRLWDGRKESGMSSFKQCRFLMQLGVTFGDALACTGREASDLIGQLKSRRVAGA